MAHIDEHETIEGGRGVEGEHLPVFDCAFTPPKASGRFVAGSRRHDGRAQPFLSGAISKTVNMPEDSTVEDSRRLN
ncbi:MAG: hypothetical protein Ct9H300mP1_00370 [Planctomycetaceae bacterium]|nr:MAG: hypothetical protein Ct9H300mP1_00370 [Planctomycetaceae bacterium]